MDFSAAGKSVKSSGGGGGKGHGFRGRYRLIVASNRDEYLDRATTPIHYWEDANQNLLAGVQMNCLDPPERYNTLHTLAQNSSLLLLRPKESADQHPCTVVQPKNDKAGRSRRPCTNAACGALARPGERYDDPPPPPSTPTSRNSEGGCSDRPTSFYYCGYGAIENLR